MFSPVVGLAVGFGALAIWVCLAYYLAEDDESLFGAPNWLVYSFRALVRLLRPGREPSIDWVGDDWQTVYPVSDWWLRDWWSPSRGVLDFDAWCSAWYAIGARVVYAGHVNGEHPAFAVVTRFGIASDSLVEGCP